MSKFVRGTDLLVAVIVSMLFTLMVLQYSFRYGRLGTNLNFDDIGYIASAADWIRLVHPFDMPALLERYYHSPPHSPYSEFLATLAFAVFGVTDWAPYAASGLLVLAMILITHRVAARQPGVLRWLAVGFILLSPIPFVAVHEFRPDVAYGLALACLGLYALSRPLERGPRAWWVGVGLLFATALWVKPAAFVPTITAFMSVCTISMLSAVSVYNAASARYAALSLRRRVFRVILGSVIAGVVGVLGFMPHLLVAGRGMINYFYDNYLGANREIWTNQGEWWGGFTYGWSGPAGELGLGPMVWILPVGLFVGVLLAWQSRLKRWKLGKLIMMSVALYIVPAYANANNPFFFLGSQTLFTFTVVMALLAPQRGTGAGRVVGRVALVFAAAAACILFRQPTITQVGDANAEWMRSRGACAESVFKAILNHRLLPRNRVAFVNTGEVGPSLFTFWARRDGLPMEFTDFSYLTDPVTIVNHLAEGQFAVASEPGNGLSASHLPAARVEGEVLQLINGDSRFTRLARYEFLTTRRGFVVFACRSDFEGWQPAAGWLLPEYNNGRAVIGTIGGHAMSNVVRAYAYAGALNLEVCSPDVVRTLQVTVNSSPAARFELLPDEFTRIDISLMAQPPTEQISFQYSGDTASEPRLVFRVLRLENAAAPDGQLPGGQTPRSEGGQ